MVCYEARIVIVQMRHITFSLKLDVFYRNQNVTSSRTLEQPAALNMPFIDVFPVRYEMTALFTLESGKFVLLDESCR